MASDPAVLHLRNSDRVSGPERLLLSQLAIAPDDVSMAIGVFRRRGADKPLLTAARTEGVRSFGIDERHAFDLRCVKVLAASLRDAPPRVLVCHDYKANLVGRKLADRLARMGAARPRLVAIVHGYTKENPKVALMEAMDRRSLKHFDAVVVVSDAMAAQAATWGVDSASLHVIENAIDTRAVSARAAAGRQAVRDQLGVDADTLLIASVGRLSPEKGLDTLLDALGTLTDVPPWHVVLVGDGVERTALERQARSLEMRSRCTFAGWQSDAAAWLGAADIYAMPSHREGLPLALLEAMASGPAIIASRVGGIPKALDEGACGLLVEPKQTGAWAAAFDTLLRDATKRESMEARALSRVTTHYDTARQAAALLDVYQVT